MGISSGRKMKKNDDDGHDSKAHFCHQLWLFCYCCPLLCCWPSVSLKKKRIVLWCVSKNDISQTTTAAMVDVILLHGYRNVSNTIFMSLYPSFAKYSAWPQNENLVLKVFEENHNARPWNKHKKASTQESLGRRQLPWDGWWSTY